MKLRAPKEFKDELALRRIHHKRQQSEMLRFLGHYHAALDLIEQANRQYPDWADEARRYSELHKADSLRLLGDAEKAVEAYERLETAARNRHQDGLLGTVLWTKIGAIQGLKNARTRKRKLKASLRDLNALVDTDANQYRYLFIYSRLVSVSSEVRNVETANKLVNEAIQAGPLKAECFRTEYAHAMLCRGEIERGQKHSKQAREFYREALHYYRLMEMQWGIVRSTIGLNLVGESRELPARIQIEGCDEVIWSRFKAGDNFPAGILCENIP
jgi:tetratricopeptide (TPR) repeat protein